MGSCWSSEPEDRCQLCNRRAVNNLIVQHGVCEICLNRATRTQYFPRPSSVPSFVPTLRPSLVTTRTTTTAQWQPHSRVNDVSTIRIKPESWRRSEVEKPLENRPLFGEFKCLCGRKWASRRSWKGLYQICKRCRRNVHPSNQRKLRPGDISRDQNVQDHPKELCQKCMQLGYYCGKMGSVGVYK